MPGLKSHDIDAIALTPITSLPDQAFFDITTRFLRCVDIVFFNNHDLPSEDVVQIRTILARRLIATRGWRSLAGSESASVEVHIGPAIGIFFFNDYDRFQPAKCYLFPKAIDQLEPFLPVLQTLIETGPSFFTALITLNLLEVTSAASHLPFVLMAALTWLRAYPESVPFWIDAGTGRRICSLIDNIWQKEPLLFNPSETVRSGVDQLLAALVRIGVPDAARVEKALINGPTAHGPQTPR